MSSIAENIKSIQDSLVKINASHPAEMDDTRLIAVSKTKPVEMLKEAYDAGIRDFGENKVQEIIEKYDKLPSDIRWHMIGHLQTNKVKYIVDKVYMIHSVDSVKLMDEIERQAEKHGISQMKILIQVNISGEETKFGTDLAGLDEMLCHAGTLNHIKVCGLMTILPKIDTSFSNRLHFHNIYNKFVDISKDKYDNVNMEFLSMGMSGDFEMAIEEGSNMVRVGTAIFGERDYSK